MFIFALLGLIGLDRTQNVLWDRKIDKYKQTHDVPFWAKPNSGVNSFRK